MKREIKFRIWDEELNEMLQPDQVCVGQNTIFIDTGKEWTDVPQLERFRTMQYTGLKDKNAKEIYEGDIVDLWPDQNDKIWHRVIEYDTAAFHSRAIHTNANHPLHFHKYSPNKDWVVIGNIYENPELLK